MASLTETAHLLRRGFILCLLFLFAFLIYSFGSSFISGLVSPGGKKQVIEAEVRFGKLPALHLGPKQSSPKAGEATTYILETVSGGFPGLPSILPVFPLKELPVDILVSDRAINLAKTLGFPGEPSKVLSPIEYLWDSPDQTQTLRMNILTKNYTVTPKYTLTFPKGKLTDTLGVTTVAKIFIATGRGLDASFSDNLTSVSLLSRQGTELKPATAPLEAEVARVDFFRTAKVGKSEYRILTIKPREALVYLMLGGGRGEPYVKNYIAWNYDFERSSTYPLRSAVQAFEDVKKGFGTITYLNGTTGDYSRNSNLPVIKTVTIREVEVGYFDEEIMQNFLQPIFIFSGQADLSGGEKADIVIYSPAVDQDWVVKQ